MTIADQPRTPTEAFIWNQITAVRADLDKMAPTEPRAKAQALEADLVRWWGELRAKEPRADWSPA